MKLGRVLRLVPWPFAANRGKTLLSRVQPMHRPEQTGADNTVDELRRESGARALISSEEEAALRHARFDEECAKLDPSEERALAEEGLAAGLADWPEY